VWPDTGHVAMLERPERLNDLLEAFLSEAPGERVAPAEPAATAGAEPAADVSA
jgi:hypothetical protein